MIKTSHIVHTVFGHFELKIQCIQLGARKIDSLAISYVFFYTVSNFVWCVLTPYQTTKF